MHVHVCANQALALSILITILKNWKGGLIYPCHCMYLIPESWDEVNLVGGTDR